MGKILKISIRIVIVIAVIILAFFVWMIIGGIKEWQQSEVQRYCLTSETPGNPPECSDSNGKPERTYINGEYLGIVSSVPETCWSDPKDPQCPRVGTKTGADQATLKKQRLADPNLLYYSSWWSGMCTNEKHEVGGCYTESYLYSNGSLIKQGGFVKYNEANNAENGSVTERQLSQAEMSDVKNVIETSDITTKDCPPEGIMDIGYDYQINLNNIKRSFHNPPKICRDIFDNIDSTINSSTK